MGSERKNSQGEARSQKTPSQKPQNPNASFGVDPDGDVFDC